MPQPPLPKGPYPGNRQQPVHLPSQQAAYHRLRQRIGDAERTAASDQLSNHFSAGRITQDEFDERLNAIMVARTTGELWRQLSDLPTPPNQKSSALAYPRPSSAGISATTATLAVVAAFCGLGIIGLTAIAAFGDSPFIVFSIGLAVLASTVLGYALGVIQRLRRERKVIEEIQHIRREDR